MSAFNYNSEDMFGNYAVIEQHRFGADNAMYLHKVVGSLKSNSYVDVPVVSPATETVHDQIVNVVACICCGVGEREVRRYRLSDVEITHNSEIARLREENERLRDALSSIADIIEAVDHRAMFSAIIPPTLKEMTQEEMSDIYALSKGHPKGWRP